MAGEIRAKPAVGKPDVIMLSIGNYMLGLGTETTLSPMFMYAVGENAKIYNISVETLRCRGHERRPPAAICSPSRSLHSWSSGRRPRRSTSATRACSRCGSPEQGRRSGRWRGTPLWAPSSATWPGWLAWTSPSRPGTRPPPREANTCAGWSSHWGGGWRDRRGEGKCHLWRPQVSLGLGNPLRADLWVMEGAWKKSLLQKLFMHPVYHSLGRWGVLLTLPERHSEICSLLSRKDVLGGQQGRPLPFFISLRLHFHLLFCRNLTFHPSENSAKIHISGFCAKRNSWRQRTKMRKQVQL